ncbi:helix-turn-helix domain-containing protein [Mycobacterium sp. 134]|uniref:AlbA family DNA-binding domain-containing protein n=1 Tax=Mycobacterium sp. 134 TaxID=3400425 RepID=UPI003AAFB6CB
MIVADGRTDAEKLQQLLVAPEETHLDFKSSVDFSNTKDRIEFVKDAVSMANRPPGGYILIGVTDDGKPAIPAGTLVNPRQFDGANLNQQVRKFIEAEIHIVSQLHTIDEHDFVLVWVPHHRDGLPVPMSATGQYKDHKNRDKVVFREGDVLVREGPANVLLRHVHWKDILKEHDAQVRAEAEKVAQGMLRTFLEERANARSPKAPAPLLMDMDNNTFAAAVIEHLESGNG